jgi:hypothetical protein
MRTSFHHQPEAQHPHSPAINTPAGRLPHLHPNLAATGAPAAVVNVFAATLVAVGAAFRAPGRLDVLALLIAVHRTTSPRHQSMPLQEY